MSWDVKNLLEFKNAKRVLIEGNIFENNWIGADQAGFAILFTPRDADGTAEWSTVEDITFRYNKVINSPKFLTILGHDTVHTSQRTSRILIHNNLVLTDSDTTQQSMVDIYSGPLDVIISHNTGLCGSSGGACTWIGQVDGTPDTDYFDFQDNIFNNGTYGFKGAGVNGGTPTLEAFFTNYTFTHNAIINAGATQYPVNNLYPANIAAVKFVDSDNGNYRLSSDSDYKNAGTDGKDLGANIDMIEMAIRGFPSLSINSGSHTLTIGGSHTLTIVP